VRFEVAGNSTPLLVVLAKLAVPLTDRIVRKHRAAEAGTSSA